MTIAELLYGIENREYAVHLKNKDEVDSFLENANDVFGYSYRFRRVMSLSEYVKDNWPAWTYVFISNTIVEGKHTFNACSTEGYFKTSGTKRQIVEWSSVEKVTKTDVEEETFIRVLTGG